jgi:cytoskeletal protein CcmA (bactofilin family)
MVGIPDLLCFVLCGRRTLLEHRMIATLKRRLMDQIQASEAPTFVTAGSRLTGDLEAAGSLVLCGEVRGDGRIGGTLRMAVTAHWEGEVHARAAMIAGKLTGKLVVDERLEVAATAVIRADIVARSIAIAKGALIDGTVTITSGEPAVKFEDRRAQR